MVFRMCNIPLSENSFKCETQRIKSIARKNGMSENIIDSLIKKHKKNKKRKDITSLSLIEDPPRRCSMNFYLPVHNDLNKIFSRANVLLAPNSSNNTKQLLKPTKDSVPNTHKPGVYSAVCSECACVYIGQTRRELRIRAKEHLNCIKNNEPYRSAIAEHSINTTHEYNIDSFTLIECERLSTRLDVLESVHIHLTKTNNINRDEGPIWSPLIELL